MEDDALPGSVAARHGKLLTTRQAAAMLGVSPRTLETWRSEDRGPSYIRYGRGSGMFLRYGEADVIKFIDERLEVVHPNNV